MTTTSDTVDTVDGVPSTELPGAGVLDRAWQVHPQVSVRPEAFGALLYHFGTRRLSFLKDPRLLTVVRALEGAATARDACVQAGLTEAQLPSFGRALQTLADTDMITERGAA